MAIDSCSASEALRDAKLGESQPHSDEVVVKIGAFGSTLLGSALLADSLE
jgi:hypothetical protein